MMYVVIQNGPFHQHPVYVFHTEEAAKAFCEKMNSGFHYQYYYEEVEIGD